MQFKFIVVSCAQVEIQFKFKCVYVNFIRYMALQFSPTQLPALFVYMCIMGRISLCLEAATRVHGGLGLVEGPRYSIEDFLLNKVPLVHMFHRLRGNIEEGYLSQDRFPSFRHFRPSAVWTKRELQSML